jgi:hypothetical protein
MGQSMTARVKSETLILRDEVDLAPVAHVCDDQSFELPSGLYVAAVAINSTLIG